MHIPRTIRMIVTDIAGVALIISAPFIGLIPGPGGVPIFLAGLGLLSIHHVWAKKLLVYVKIRGNKLIDVFFPENRLIMFLYDVLFIILTVVAVFIIYRFTGNISTSIGIFILFLGFGVFVSNRKRLYRISNWFKKFSH